MSDDKDNLFMIHQRDWLTSKQQCCWCSLQEHTLVYLCYKNYILNYCCSFERSIDFFNQHFRMI